MMDGMTDGRPKSSMAPLFQSRAKYVSDNGSEILGRVGRQAHMEKKIYNFMHFERRYTFQNA